MVGRLGHFLDQMSAGFQDFLVPQPGKGYNEEKVRVNFFFNESESDLAPPQ